MNYLVKDVVILHAGSPYHLLKKDILISDGIIAKIGDNLENKFRFFH